MKKTKYVKRVSFTELTKDDLETMCDILLIHNGIRPDAMEVINYACEKLFNELKQKRKKYENK